MADVFMEEALFLEEACGAQIKMAVLHTVVKHYNNYTTIFSLIIFTLTSLICFCALFEISESTRIFTSVSIIRQKSSSTDAGKQPFC